MAWVEKRGQLWRGKYRDETGAKRTAGSSKNRKTALQLAVAEELKIQRGEWADPNAGKMLFSTYFEEHWLPNRVNELNTIKSNRSNYNAGLKATFGPMEVRAIRKAHVQRWVAAQVKAGVTARTIEARFKTLQSCLAARKGVSAIADELITVNPCQGISLPVVDRRPVTVFSVEESDLILDAMARWWCAVVMLASETGVRWGELMGLKVGDFSDDFRTVHVQDVILEVTKAEAGDGSRFMWKPRPKGRKGRDLRLSAEAATSVAMLVRERQLFPKDRLLSMPDKSGLLPRRTDAWPTGLPISRSFFREGIWLRALAASGVERNGRRFHDLRGTWITWALAGGADIKSVMDAAGHADVATTQRYMAAMADADERVLDAVAATKARYRRSS